MKARLRLTLSNIVWTVPSLLMPLLFWPSSRDPKAPDSGTQIVAGTEGIDRSHLKVAAVPLALAALVSAGGRERRAAATDTDGTATLDDPTPSLLLTTMFQFALYAFIFAPFWPRKGRGKTPIADAGAIEGTADAEHQV